MNRLLGTRALAVCDRARADPRRVALRCFAWEAARANAGTLDAVGAPCRYWAGARVSTNAHNAALERASQTARNSSNGSHVYQPLDFCSQRLLPYISLRVAYLCGFRWFTRLGVTNTRTEQTNKHRGRDACQSRTSRVWVRNVAGYGNTTHNPDAALLRRGTDAGGWRCRRFSRSTERWTCRWCSAEQAP